MSRILHCSGKLGCCCFVVIIIMREGPFRYTHFDGAQGELGVCKRNNNQQLVLSIPAQPFSSSSSNFLHKHEHGRSSEKLPFSSPEAAQHTHKTHKEAVHRGKALEFTIETSAHNLGIQITQGSRTCGEEKGHSA